MIRLQETQQRQLPTDRLGFYVASGDQDILSQVNRLMQRSGYIGVMDTAGRFQYIIDGRKGSPLAARRILETTGRILRDRQDTGDTIERHLEEAADQVLAAHAIRPELKGYRFLRYMLLYAGLDETRLRPVSKSLYPAVASHFRVSLSQIERDIRYALQKTDLRARGLASAAAICHLYDEVVRQAGKMMDKDANNPSSAGGQEKPSGIYTDAGV